MTTAIQENGLAERSAVNEQRLVREVLRRLAEDAAGPNLNRRKAASGKGREYLSRAEASAIVDESIEASRNVDEEGMHAYLSGHRERLIRSLAAIPKAAGPGRACLDVGCFGYMMVWAEKHLGYDRVEGVELRPESDDKVMSRAIRLGGGEYEFRVHNFDISTPAWPIDGEFDTVLFFETLEHVNEDPMGVMERIGSCMPMGGSLVMSVPNAVSYKSVRELLVGMPPWTYWFYEPDLKHEPRHAFEYTPVVFRTLVASAGFEEDGFFSLYAYSSKESEREIAMIAERAGIDTTHFGETMVCRSFKAAGSPPIRYPSVLYDPERYYRIAFPLISKELGSVVDRAVESISTEARLEARVDELLFICDLRADEADKQKAREAELLFVCNQHAERVQELEGERDSAVEQVDALSEEAGVLRGRVDELLFACDLYLQRVDDPAYCAQVVRRSYARRWIDRTKRAVQRVPVVRRLAKRPYNFLKRVIKSRM